MGIKDAEFKLLDFSVSTVPDEILLEAAESGTVRIAMSDDPDCTTVMIFAQYDYNVFILANFDLKKLVIEDLKRKILEKKAEGKPSHPSSHASYEQAIGRTKRKSK